MKRENNRKRKETKTLIFLIPSYLPPTPFLVSWHCLSFSNSYPFVFVCLSLSFIHRGVHSDENFDCILLPWIFCLPKPQNIIWTGFRFLINFTGQFIKIYKTIFKKEMGEKNGHLKYDMLYHNVRRARIALLFFPVVVLAAVVQGGGGSVAGVKQLCVPDWICWRALMSL